MDNFDHVSPEEMQDNSLLPDAETGDQELSLPGWTVIDRGRRGTRHKIIIMGGTAIDGRIED